MKPINHQIIPLLIFSLLVGPAALAATADDVECIRCVDTTDINYDAVTSNRILDGTIRSVDIGLDAVTSSRIRAGEVRTSDLAPNAVTTSRIMNGAVTEAKLAQELLDIISQLQAEVAALKVTVASQQATLSEQEEVLAYFSYEELYDPSTGYSYPTLRVTGANLQLVNGLNDTATVNGTGNLIVGYNQLSTFAACSDGQYADETSCTNNGAIWSSHHRSGSHNIVTGEGQNYSRYGGFIAGIFNTINRRYASVSGGNSNTASGYFSSVSGGYKNIAHGYSSSVSGGNGNTASESHSSVSGGRDNTASGYYSSVSGGYLRSAVDSYDWAGGSLYQDF